MVIIIWFIRVPIKFRYWTWETISIWINFKNWHWNIDLISNPHCFLICKLFSIVFLLISSNMKLLFAVTYEYLFYSTMLVFYTVWCQQVGKTGAGSNVLHTWPHTDELVVRTSLIRSHGKSKHGLYNPVPYSPERTWTIVIMFHMWTNCTKLV